jgi:hypothetical protein
MMIQRHSLVPNTSKLTPVLLSQRTSADDDDNDDVDMDIDDTEPSEYIINCRGS